MKKLMITSCLIALISFTPLRGYAVSNTAISTEIVFKYETETFKVYGNCGMCKRTIESSLKGIKGVKKAVWNIETKMITVTFDPTIITLTNIKETIAGVGYDSDEVRADDNIYNGLPSCCQYERAK